MTTETPDAWTAPFRAFGMALVMDDPALIAAAVGELAPDPPEGYGSADPPAGIDAVRSWAKDRVGADVFGIVKRAGRTPNLGNVYVASATLGVEASARLTVAQAVEAMGVTERTVRRWLKTGRVSSVVFRSPRGDQHLIALGDLIAAKGGDAPAPGGGQGASDQWVKSVGLAAAAAEAARDQSARLAALLEAQALMMEEQRKLIDDLRAEVRDSRAQMHQMQTEVLKALPAPRRPWWSRIFGG